MPQKDDTLLQYLMDKHIRTLAKMAYNHGVPIDDAEDIAMEALWSYYNSDHYDRQDERDAMLMLAKIVKNKSIDLYRKTYRLRTMTISSDDEEMAELRAPSEQEPERIVISNEGKNNVLDVLDRLKPIWREVAIMAYLEGRSYAEISKALDISEDVCRSRLSRAKKFLLSELKDQLE